MWVFIVAFFPVNVLQRTRCAACECVHAADKNAFFSPQPLFTNFRFFHSRHFPAPGKKVCYVFKIRWANVKFFYLLELLNIRMMLFFRVIEKDVCLLSESNRFFAVAVFSPRKKNIAMGKNLGRNCKENQWLN